MATGGSIESVSYAGREFSVAADSDAGIKIGGFENEVQSNGNATFRLIKTRVPGQLGPLDVDIDHSRGDLLWLQERVNSKKFEVTTVTLADGTTYQAATQIIGEFPTSTMNTTVALTFAGTVFTAQ